MLRITPKLQLNESELDFSYIRSPGPGGQNVNKVATAVQLRFNIVNSASLSEDIRARLIKLAANKINQNNELIIKAARYRSQERNKQDALNRLKSLIKLATATPKKRKKTKPTAASIEERLSQKKRLSQLKSARRNTRLDNFTS